jgi:PAS domain S-box-containing protein
MANDLEFASLRAGEERLAFLLRLSDALRPLADPLDMQEVAARYLGEYLHANRVGYAELEDNRSTIRREWVCGVKPLAGRRMQGAFGEELSSAFRRGETVVVCDVDIDPRFSESQRATMRTLEIAAFAGVMLLKGGRLVAAFGANSATPRTWTSSELDLIRDVAERTWEAVERAHAEAAVRGSEERLAFLLKLSDALRPLSDPVEMTGAASRLLGEHLKANRVSYADIEGDEYVMRHIYESGVAPVGDRGPVSCMGTAFLGAYRRGEAIAVADVRTDPRLTDGERAGLSTHSIAAFAMVATLKNGQWVSALGVHSARPRAWTQPELELIRDVAERNWEAVERARAEAALREREWRLRLALDASAGGSWTWEARTDHIDWDHGFRVRYGFAPDVPASQDLWLSRVHEEDRAQVLALLDDMLRTTRDSWDNTFRIVLSDGTVRWIQSLGRAERASDGEVTRLTGLDLDITERRRTEQAREARRNEERDRELRLLLETATQGIVSVDPHGLIMTANPGLETMFGWESGALVGQPIERLVPTAFREPYTEAYFADPRPLQIGVDSELFGLRKDGTTFPIEVSLSHAATPGGRRALAFVTDVTARKRAESALHERTVELERRTAQLRKLASDLTLAEQHAREQLAKTLHDGLQQLLVSASMNLDRQVTHDAERGSGADELLLQAKVNLDEAINAARSLSFELFPPVLHGSGLPAALTWLADWMRHQHGLVVHVSADPLANSSRKDVRTLLFESVRELLFNTVKHARVDRAVLDLSLGTDSTLCITVEDRGIGFDPAKVVDEAKDGQVGWGLFSIRERLTLLGGRLDVESAPGQGTRFRLIVPNGHARTVGTQRSSGSVAGGPASLGLTGAAPPRALRIVIVDDHVAVRKAFREMLQERPELRVVGEAANGVEAIAVARAIRPDVILMDVSMPEMDGVEATRRIRAELPFIQILGLSTHLRGGSRHAIEEVGAVGFFTKGVDTHRLIDHLIAVHATTALGLQGQPR